MALLVLVAAGPAHAGVIAEDPLDDTSTEAGVVARTYSLVLAGPVLEPPRAPDDANPTALGLFDLRGYFSTKTPAWKLVLHNTLSGVASSHALGGLAIGSSAAPPRWLPLTLTIADDPTVTLRDTVDWLSVAYTHGPVTITAGRQPVSFGRAKLWSPMDLLAPFSLTEVDTEYRHGVDALRVDASASDRLNATVVAVAGELADDHDLDASITGSALIGRLTYRLDHAEAGMLAGYVRGDLVAGLGGVWDTGSFDVFGEATATFATSRSLAMPGASHTAVPKAAVGATFHPTSTLTIDPELLFNGAGTSHVADYLTVAASPRVAIGEQVTLGRLYAAAVADWQPHPLVHVVAASIANLQDPSALASIAMAYSVAGNATAQLGCYLPLGHLPATATPAVPRSEYGLYPVFAFLELKVVL